MRKGKAGKGVLGLTATGSGGRAGRARTPGLHKADAGKFPWSRPPPRKSKHGHQTQKKPAKSPLRLLTAPLLILAAALLLWYAYAGFSDRHWHNYREAGNRAYARGNYAWAAKMYSKALKEARDLDPYDSPSSKA